VKMACACVAFAWAMGLSHSFSAPVSERDRGRDYPVQKKEEIRKTLTFADASKTGEVVVDNVFGPVTVEGYDGKDVLLVAHKTIYAKTEDKAARALEEVKLDLAEKGRTVDIYVDGPFRENDRSGHRFRSWRDPGYEVHYAFEIKVPFKTDVAVATVTDGDIEVRQVQGEFDIHNVNGKVRMSDIVGEGEAETVNGTLVVAFRNVPSGRCAFKTVNGDLVLTLPGNTSADFRIRTWNGNAYSDFPVTQLPARPPVRDENKGKFVYKSDRSFGVRAGKGGPEIALDTMNGDILIKKRTA
jgi:ribosomal protein S28E/S33